MYCRNCGAENENGINYCAECGAPLNTIHNYQNQPARNPLKEKQDNIVGKSYNFTRTIWFKFSNNVAVSFKSNALEIGVGGAKHIPYSSITNIYERETVNIGEVAALVIGVFVGIICLLGGSVFLGLVGIVLGLMSISHLKNTIIFINSNSGQFKITMDSSDADKRQFPSELRIMTNKE